MNDFISKIKYDNEIKNKTENNIIWLKKQIDELFPYKKKCIMLNKEINKLQNQCDIIKNKSEYNNKIIQEKEKINILKFKKAKNKIRDSFGEFIKINLPNKLDEFNSLFKDLGFDNE